jgi:hypothetical protein
MAHLFCFWLFIRLYILIVLQHFHIVHERTYLLLVLLLADEKDLIRLDNDIIIQSFDHYQLILRHIHDAVAAVVHHYILSYQRIAFIILFDVGI